MRRALAILWLISLSSCAVLNEQRLVEDTVFTPRLSSALQKTLLEINEIQNSDGISASLYISDRCYWEGAAGVTKQDARVPVEPDMLFSFASITKTFVAAIVLQLVEENKLALNDPLEKWLVPYPNIDSKITIRQLLNHGSGLDGYFGDDLYWDEINADANRVWHPKDILKFVGPPPIIGFSPPWYTNTNYILLGMIIEASTGNSLEHEIHSRITDPLNLENTYLPKNYFNPERWANNTHLFNSLYSSVWAAGAIASTSTEIAKFMHSLNSGNLLQINTLELMRVTEPRRSALGGFSMGLGVYKIAIDGEPAWGHGGSLHPFISQTFYLPKFELSVAYSSSGADVSKQPLPGLHLVRAYLENRPDDLSMCFES